MALSRADVLMAATVLRALGYAVNPSSDTSGTTLRPNAVAALRTFQDAANRERGARLKVDGILGQDSANALAWYGAQPYASAPERLHGGYLTAAEWTSVQAAIRARKDNPWGQGPGGTGGTTGGGRGGGSGGSSGSSGSSGTTTASTIATSINTAVIVVGALGVAMLGATELWKRHAARKAVQGGKAPSRASSEPRSWVDPDFDAESRSRVSAPAAARKASAGLASQLDKFVSKGKRR